MLKDCLNNYKAIQNLFETTVQSDSVDGISELYLMQQTLGNSINRLSVRVRFNRNTPELGLSIQR